VVKLKHDRVMGWQDRWWAINYS